MNIPFCFHRIQIVVFAVHSAKLMTSGQGFVYLKKKTGDIGTRLHLHAPCKSCAPPLFFTSTTFSELTTEIMTAPFFPSNVAWGLPAAHAPHSKQHSCKNRAPRSLAKGSRQKKKSHFSNAPSLSCPMPSAGTAQPGLQRATFTPCKGGAGRLLLPHTPEKRRELHQSIFGGGLPLLPRCGSSAPSPPPFFCALGWPHSPPEVKGHGGGGGRSATFPAPRPPQALRLPRAGSRGRK